MRNRLSILILSAFMVLAFAAGAPAAEKNMVFASPYGITTFDPSVSYSTELTYMANVYETLIRVNPPGSEELFSYVLATGYTASEDGLTYTFNLRRGVKFHDGTDFKADAVKFSIERTRKIGKGASFIWADLKEIRIVDDYTVRFILGTPVPLPQIAASAYASYIMSPAAADKDQAWFDKGNDAGTGPYTIKRYKDGESWMLAKFADYWGGWDGRHVENILVKYTKEPLIQMQMLQSGQAMLGGRLPIDSYKRFQENPKTTVLYVRSQKNGGSPKKL